MTTQEITPFTNFKSFSNDQCQDNNLIDRINSITSIPLWLEDETPLPEKESSSFVFHSELPKGQSIQANLECLNEKIQGLFDEKLGLKPREKVVNERVLSEERQKERANTDRLSKLVSNRASAFLTLAILADQCTTPTGDLSIGGVINTFQRQQSLLRMSAKVLSHKLSPLQVFKESAIYEEATVLTAIKIHLIYFFLYYATKLIPNVVEYLVHKLVEIIRTDHSQITPLTKRDISPQLIERFEQFLNLHKQALNEAQEKLTKPTINAEDLVPFKEEKMKDLCNVTMDRLIQDCSQVLIDYLFPPGKVQNELQILRHWHDGPLGFLAKKISKWSAPWFTNQVRSYLQTKLPQSLSQLHRNITNRKTTPYLYGVMQAISGQVENLHKIYQKTAEHPPRPAPLSPGRREKLEMLAKLLIEVTQQETTILEGTTTDNQEGWINWGKIKATNFATVLAEGRPLEAKIDTNFVNGLTNGFALLSSLFSSSLQREKMLNALLEKLITTGPETHQTVQEEADRLQKITSEVDSKVKAFLSEIIDNSDLPKSTSISYNRSITSPLTEESFSLPSFSKIDDYNEMINDLSALRDLFHYWIQHALSIPIPEDSSSSSDQRKELQAFLIQIETMLQLLKDLPSKLNQARSLKASFEKAQIPFKLYENTSDFELTVENVFKIKESITPDLCDDYLLITETFDEISRKIRMKNALNLNIFQRTFPTLVRLAKVIPEEDRVHLEGVLKNGIDLEIDRTIGSMKKKYQDEIDLLEGKIVKRLTGLLEVKRTILSDQEKLIANLIEELRLHYDQSKTAAENFKNAYKELRSPNQSRGWFNGLKENGKQRANEKGVDIYKTIREQIHNSPQLHESLLKIGLYSTYLLYRKEEPEVKYPPGY